MTDSQPDRTEEIRGPVTRIVYRNEETGYTVCAVADPAQARAANASQNSRPRRRSPFLFDSKSASDRRAAKGEITVVGSCAAIWVGENLKATGHWIQHKKHGRQFEADQMACVAPVSTDGIRLYLASGVIKGIGEVNAARLVSAFGDNTLKVIDLEPERLLEVPGIGRKTYAKITESWDTQKAVRDVMIFLRGHGIGNAQANRICRHYGSDAVAIVTANPYRLCRDIWGIGFKTADSIAMSVGIPRESDVRARAGILYALLTMADDGHCFCPWDVLLEEAQALLDIPTEILNRAVEYEIAEKTLTESNGKVYLTHLSKAEDDVARKLTELLNSPQNFRAIDTDKAVPWAEKKMQIQFAPAQKDALAIGLSHKVSLITGGPGVGKTTIMKALVDVFDKRKLAVSLAAPTGRAAKRLSEATGCEAKTLHRLLKFQPGKAGFEHGPNNTLPGDVFILDEVSMIDISLMQLFLTALDSKSHLILVGDSDQLPSIGPGSVMKDLITCGAIPCKRLTAIFRQQSESCIVRNAHRVNNGELIETPRGDALSDFYFVEADEPDAVIGRMLNLVSKRIPERFRLDPMTDIQVLTPMRKNQLGADNLNIVLQQALNPRGDSLDRFGQAYRTRDRVMQIRNNYDKDVFNGDIGIIKSVDMRARVVTVTFDQRTVSYQEDELDELRHAYACSIHKSQGSEFPAVVVLMTTLHFKMLQRNLLYTAMTRGRNLVCLIGSQKAVKIAVSNNDTLLRRTSLAAKLASALR